MKVTAAYLAPTAVWLLAARAAYIPFGMKDALTGSNVPGEFVNDAKMSGAFPFVASRSDPRISYAVYVPPSHYYPKPNETHPKLPLLVDIHGTSRDTSAILSEKSHRFFAEETPCAVVAPLFPAGLEGPNDLDSYKVLRTESLRSDLALLNILEEVAYRWPGVETRKFYLMGFSGGGQFAHRFLYLYPERLSGVSIGAPGLVTGLDNEKDWPDGVANVEELFDRTVEKELIREIPIQLVVGGEDTTVHGGEGFQKWLSEALGDGELPRRGESRVDTLTQLHEDWATEGIKSQLDIVPGVGHIGSAPAIREAVYSYLGSSIKKELDQGGHR